MRALPEQIDEDERPTGLACPDCPGVLGVKRIGLLITFRCRIGHAYTLCELLAAKEERVEDRFWGLVTALEELTALLEDARGEASDFADDRQIANRIASARAHAECVRDMVAVEEPLAFRRTEEGAGDDDRDG